MLNDELKLLVMKAYAQAAKPLVDAVDADADSDVLLDIMVDMGSLAEGVAYSEEVIRAQARHLRESAEIAKRGDVAAWNDLPAHGTLYTRKTL